VKHQFVAREISVKKVGEAKNCRAMTAVWRGRGYKLLGAVRLSRKQMQQGVSFDDQRQYEPGISRTLSLKARQVKGQVAGKPSGNFGNSLRLCRKLHGISHDLRHKQDCRQHKNNTSFHYSNFLNW